MKHLPDVNSESKYYEPDHWKFGTEGNNYFRHATRQLYAVTRDLATYISANRWVLIWICKIGLCYFSISYLFDFTFRHILHKYSNEDVSFGSWLIGLDVEHVDERSLCCGTPPGSCLTLVSISMLPQHILLLHLFIFCMLNNDMISLNLDVACNHIK